MILANFCFIFVADPGFEPGQSNYCLRVMSPTFYHYTNPQYILKNDLLLLNKNPKWTPSIRKNTPFIRIFMWFFSGLHPRFLIFTFFLITFFLSLDSILFSETLLFFIRCINICTNKIRKNTEKITENNYHSIIFIIFVAGVGLEPTTPLWGAPAYETGEIPTSRPRDFKNLCLSRVSLL